MIKMHRRLGLLLFYVLPIGLSSQLLLSCQELKTLPLQPNEEGTVYIGSTDHKFQALDAQTGAKKWEITTNEVISSLPAIYNGLIYVGAAPKFYAFSAKDGTKQWEFTPEDQAGMGLRPTVYNQKVYVLGNGSKTLYALDAQSGNKLWSTTSAAFVQQGGWFTDPAVADGVVVMGGTDSTLHALDAQTGANKWSFKANSTFQSRPLIVNGVVYAGCYNGKLYALDAKSGQRLWESALGGWMQSPQLVDQFIYVTNWSTVYGVDAKTGNQRWQFTPHIYSTYTGNIGLISVTNGAVYGCFVPLDWNDGFIYTLDATTGAEKKDLLPWPGKLPLGGNCAQGHDGILYVPGMDKTLRAIDGPTGAVKWSYQAGGNLTYSLGITDNQGGLITP